MSSETSQINAEVEYAYVSEVTHETIIQQEAYTAPELPNNLVNRKKFIELVQERFPEKYSPAQAAQLWDVLFGNQPRPEPLKELTEEEQNLLNPHVRYLTLDSCTQILNHLVQFSSGIDFQHLPSGFVLIKNPQGSGTCEVLHYNEYYARFQPEEEDKVLAFTLMDQNELKSAPEMPHPFTGAQATWYELFRKKRISKAGIYCTEEQLLNAFMRLSALVQEKGCKFEDLEFNKDFETQIGNPLLLIGHWATVMTNPNLKVTDVSKQWKVLPQLALATSHEAIRAISDYAGQAGACGFLRPEMNLTQQGFIRKLGSIEDLPTEFSEDIFKSSEKSLAAGILSRQSEKIFKILWDIVIKEELKKRIKVQYIPGFKLDDHFTTISGEILPRYHYFDKKNQNYSAEFYNKILFYSNKYYFDHFQYEDDPRYKEPFFEGQVTKKDDDDPNKNPINFELEKQELKLLDDSYRAALITSFWRYLAYNPNRHSLSFYENALDHLQKIPLNSSSFETLLQALASSTTHCNSKKNEDQDLEIWAQFCNQINENGMQNEKVRWIYLMSNSGLTEYPRIAFLTDMLRTNFLYKPVSYGNNYKPFYTAQETWVFLISFLNNAFYQGAKFYFAQPKWTKLNINHYLNLQYQFFKLDGGLYEIGEVETTGARVHPAEPELFRFHLLAPHLSTFNLDTIEKIQSLLSHFSSNLNVENKEYLQFCFSLFEEVQNNKELTPALLIELIQYITQFVPPVNQNWRLMLLDYLKTKVKSAFEPQFFEKKAKQLIEASLGLNNQQIANIKSAFPENTWSAIINLQTLLVKQKLGEADVYLNHLNTQLLNLKYIIPAEDFLLFVEQLSEMGPHIAADYKELPLLLHHIIKKRNTDSFNQIFIRNEIEQTRQNLPKKCLIFIAYIKELSQIKDLKLNPLVLQETLATLVLNTAATHLEPVESYQQSIKELIEQLNQAANAHPHLAPYLLDSFNHLPNKNSDLYFAQALTLGQDLKELSELLPSTGAQSKESMVIIYSLLAHYHESPLKLSLLMTQIRELSAAQRPLVLKFLSRLLDNKQSIQGLESLIALLAVEKNQTLFASLCASPPYPYIPTLVQWIQSGAFESHYAAFNLQPLGPRRLDFTFNLKQYHKQKQRFVGVGELFTKELGLKLQDQLNQNRHKSIQQLLQEYEEVRRLLPLNNENKLKLLCLCVEVLARTASQSDPDSKNKISQELNTTQIMALYAKLAYPSNRLISQIDTGEGKSRVMMVLAACQAAQGKTVDFLTSDLQLAERDYLSYRQFFTTLNIPSSLISLNTPAHLYQKGGINITDNSQLLLLRNKSDIEGCPFAYKDEKKENRCLLIDEVDKFIHDKSNDSCNYATQSKHLADFVWIYPNLMQFIESLNLKQGQPFDAQKEVESFLTHIKKNVLNKMHKASLLQMAEENPSQITTWLKSAHKAWFMEPNKHYLKTDTMYLVRDSEGRARYSYKIYVLDNGRPVEGSTFSDGVHQCIAAKENRLLQKQKRNKKNPFVILPENEILRPSFPATFMADYDQGSIYGVSGTTRSAAPLSNFAEINYEKYTYLIMPREKPLIREEKNVWLAKDEAQQIEFLKRAIIKKMREGGPVLLICKDDKQSLVLQQALEQDAKFKAQIKNLQIQRVHGKTPKKEEVKAIEQAGKNQVLTLSTAGMMGRGVDIDSNNLEVLAAYIPTEDDEIQIKGRAARIGKPGSYRMIINKADLDYPINGHTYNVHNEVYKSQRKRQKSAAFMEEASKLFAFFREDIIRMFLDNSARCSDEDRLELFKKWQSFLGNLHRNWESCRTELLKAGEAQQKDQFFKIFNAFTEEWLGKAPLQLNKPDSEKQNQKLNTIYTAMMAQQRFFVPQRQPIKVQKEYDLADDGQARIYSTLFAKTRATLRGERRFFADFHAWREGRGELFPDFMATLRGERMPFANLYATITRWIQEWTQWFSAVNQKSPQTIETPIEDNPNRIAIQT